MCKSWMLQRLEKLICLVRSFSMSCDIFDLHICQDRWKLENWCLLLTQVDCRVFIYRCQSWGPPVFIPRFPGHLYQFHFIVTRAQWWRPPLPRWMSVSVRWWPPGKSFRASAGHLSSLDCALFTSNIARISRHCHHGLFQTFLYLQQSTNNFFDSLIVWCVVCM